MSTLFCRMSCAGVWRVTAALVMVGPLAGCNGTARSSTVGSTHQSSVPGVANAIRTIVADTGHDAFGPPSAGERAQLAALYAPRRDVPLWVDTSGRPSRDAREALALLSGAANEGLDPVEYAAPMLEQMARMLESTAPAATDVADFDTSLSANTLRYLRQLHEGRVDPRAIGFHMTTPADEHDFVAFLSDAVTRHRIIEAAAELTPPFALYRGLRSMLARYRSLAADPTLESLLPPGAPVRPGDRYAELRTLHRRLVALGDLPGDTPLPEGASVYEGALIDGVKHFQVRHGLHADGVLGGGTQAALRVPLSWRVRQIELALERLRWLPHLDEERFLAVNIPMFRLWAWDTIPANGAPAFGMGVIVGRALNTQTPVFVEDMRYIIFRPYWNVPASIVRREIAPVLQRDPDYLRREDMEIVSDAGDNARPVALTPESLAQLRQGTLRVRQRPGPRNSLGLVKFVFPNDANVYLHATPAPQLFSQSRRDFSHGCVRVEDPIALAEWALKAQPGWTRDRILGAMNGKQSLRVNLTQPIRVILFYVTAVVMPEDGTIRFAEDIYGHDAKLDQALMRGQPTQ